MEGTKVTAAGMLAGQSMHVEDIHRQHRAQAREETGRCHCINATRLASFTARVRVGQINSEKDSNYTGCNYYLLCGKFNLS